MIKKLMLPILLVLFAPHAQAKSHLLSSKAAEQVEASYNKLTGKDAHWRLDKKQAFEVRLNSNTLKNVVFAPFSNNDVRFVLLSSGGKSILQTLPESELAIVKIFSFQKVEAVSFEDINADGTQDIIVLNTYFDSRPVQGDGVGGGTTKIGFAFLSKKNKFEINDDCGEDVQSMSALRKCVKDLVKSQN